MFENELLNVIFEFVGVNTMCYIILFSLLHLAKPTKKTKRKKKKVQKMNTKQYDRVA